MDNAENIKTPAPMGLKGDPCAPREKYWDELSIEEKIERTRRMVKQVMETQGSEINFLRNHLYKLENKFESHQHNNGEVLVKLNYCERNQVIGEQAYTTSFKEEQNKFF